MRPALKSQHCPALVKEQREVLDDAARRYRTDWHVKNGKHAKIYLGEKMICVLSHSHNRNRHEPIHPADRLRKQIEQAMKGA